MCLGHREGVPLLSIHLFCVLTLSHFPLMKPLLLSFRVELGVRFPAYRTPFRHRRRAEPAQGFDSVMGMLFTKETNPGILLFASLQLIHQQCKLHLLQ